MKSLFLYILTLVFVPFSWAQEAKRPYLLRSTLGEAGFSVTTSIEGRIYAIEASVGQASAIGTFYGIKYSAIQGFIQPFSFATGKEPIPFSNLLVTIFPNPFSEELNISFSKQITGTVEVEVYDMMGRTVFSKSYPAEQAIALRLNPGLIANYLLKITYKNQAYLKKITRH